MLLSLPLSFKKEMCVKTKETLKLIAKSRRRKSTTFLVSLSFWERFKLCVA